MDTAGPPYHADLPTNTDTSKPTRDSMDIDGGGSEPARTTIRTATVDSSVVTPRPEVEAPTPQGCRGTVAQIEVSAKGKAWGTHCAFPTSSDS